MEKITLKNGIRILLEEQETSKTACFGIWVKSGSIYENEQNNGISHFIEHMVFKGSEKRNAREIAEQMDYIGGQLNAFTAKDYTCFYAKTLDYHVHEGFDILCDMVSKAKMDSNDIETEKKVVLEEINMSADMPDDRVVENMYKSVFNGSSLAMPILGKEETLKNINYDSISSYMKENYSADKIVIAICGKFDKDKFIDIANKYFCDFKPSSNITQLSPIIYNKSKSIIFDDCEQVHINIAFKGINSFDEKRYALSVLNIIAGASSSSRLFQRIREDLGLAYSVYSSATSYKDTGLFEVQTAVNPSCAQKAYQEIISILSNLKNGVTELEFKRAKEQLKSGLLMGLESNASRAGFMGRNELLKNRIRREDDIINDVNSVTIQDVYDIANQIIDIDNHSLSVVGPLKDLQLDA